MNKEFNKYFQNAYPSTPIQDNFNQLGFLPQGLSRLEHFALQIYCSAENLIDYKAAIEEAVNFINAIDDYKENLNKPTTLEIIK